MRVPSHIMIGDRTWCDWLGCKAGQDTAKATGVTSCAQPSLAAGRRAVAALAPHFKPGIVRTFRGVCPNDQGRRA